MVNNFSAKYVQPPFGDVPSTGQSSLYDIHSNFVLQLQKLIERPLIPGAGGSDVHAGPGALEASFWGHGISDSAGKNICELLDGLSNRVDGIDRRAETARILEDYEEALGAALKATCCFTNSTSKDVKTRVRLAIGRLRAPPKMMKEQWPSSIKGNPSMNESGDSLFAHAGAVARLNLQQGLKGVIKIRQKRPVFNLRQPVKFRPQKFLSVPGATEKQKDGVSLILLDAGG